MSLVLTKDDESLRSEFVNLSTPQDVASLLDVKYYELKYYLYILENSRKYFSFSIRKKSGGERQILSPSPSLKIIQSKLLQVLGSVYNPKATVHGFVKDKSIVTNASMHSSKRNLLNLDLLDFFAVINFGRVRGLFMSRPYGLNDKVATILAQICCHDNQLPQGAPTSPIISNMICARMDSQLLGLAVQNRCVYTRYADDLTFSTTIRRFPGSLASILPSGEVDLGSDLLEIIISNGFHVNSSKTRLQTEHRRQEVTGLVVNKFPNIKREFILQVRAMLHDWRVNGIEIAQRNHLNKWRTKDTPPFKDEPSFKNIVKGKIDFIGMVRGKEDPIYRKYLYEYTNRDPDYSFPYLFPPQPETSKAQVMIFTEGKTDYNHLKAAHRYFQGQGKFTNLFIYFKDDGEDFGDDKLLKLCTSYSKYPIDHPYPAIFLFDNDNYQILTAANIFDKPFHSWGRNVYSAKLPVPSHREHSPDICIEFLYTDEEIRRVDNEGHRLYISSEFVPGSGRHHSESLVYTNQKRLAKSPHDFIIDDGVFDDTEINIALPKSKFAGYVLNQTSNYDNFDFSAFEPLLDLFINISRSED